MPDYRAGFVAGACDRLLGRTLRVAYFSHCAEYARGYQDGNHGRAYRA